MAKKNGRDDPPKPQVAENEQMSDIILILDKMELILQAVSQITRTAGTRRFRQTRSIQTPF